MSGMMGSILPKLAAGLWDMFPPVSASEVAGDQWERYDNDVDKQQDRESTLDYEPTYAGDLIKPYQRSSSPVARSYLESILTGQNAQHAADPGGDPTAVKRAQNSFDGTYGPYEALVKRGERERKATPWKTARPEEIDQVANSRGIKNAPDASLVYYYGGR
jgi:hypothetical protein